MTHELDCEQLLLVQADWDGELSAAESAMVLSHRQNCATCTRAYETLQLTRTADLFPRVRVRYTVTAHASVYSCLEDASSATWNLAEVGP